MALLAGTPLADARLWFGAVFLAAMALAARYTADEPRAVRGELAAGRGSRAPGPALGTTALGPALGTTALGPGQGIKALLLAGFPAVALPLAVGGVDLPVIGLMCLGLALAGRGGAGAAAGVAMGAAAALKWTAWPLLAVGLALLMVTAGRRAALRGACTALLVSAVVVVPSVLADPHAFVEQVVLFPLDAAHTGSPATSPLPGYLLATHVPGGRAVAVTALMLSAAAIVVSLLVRPPHTTTAAARRLALGLGLAMCLMPATRFGYLVYPLVLVAWFSRPEPLRLAGRATVPTGWRSQRIRFARWYVRHLFSRMSPGIPVCVHDVFHGRRAWPFSEGAVVLSRLAEQGNPYFTASRAHAPKIHARLNDVKRSLALEPPLRHSPDNPMIFFTLR